MTAPVFNQAAGRLYALSSSGDAGIAGYWAGYLCSAGARFGAQASLQQAWADAGGVYLFLKTAPTDAAAFAGALEDLLPQLSPQGWARWLWIANPNDPAAYWQARQLDALPVADPAAAWRVVRDARFDIGSYVVGIGGGAILDLETAAGQESVRIGATRLCFVAPGGVYPAQDQYGRLPFAGAGVGGLAFGISLINGGQTPDDMDRLGVMLRYGLENPDSPYGAVGLIDMPLLRQTDATAIPLRINFDPLNPLDGDRSNAAFFPADTAPPALACALLTNRGYGTLLTPLNGASPLSPARFVFGRTPLFRAESEIGATFDYHLTPDGAFGLSCAAPGPAKNGAQDLPASAERLMLGASGTEYAVLPTAGGSLVFFRGGGAAYVPAPSGDNGTGKPERVLLSPLGTTAYANVLPGSAGGAGLAYYAQPLQAPLFDAEGIAGAGFLDFLEMQAASLPTYRSGDPKPPAVMPIAAYSRIASAVIDQARLIEAAALAPARRAIIGLPTEARGEIASATPLDDAPVAVTPQGLVAVLTEDRQHWAGVLLANMPDSVHKQLTLTAVGPAMQAALQSNQLFFVVSNVDTFMGESSVSYQLTADNALRLMKSTGVPDTVAFAVMQALADLDPPYPLFLNEAAFDAAVGSAAGGWLPQVRSAAGLLRADMEGWNFQLSPRSWRKDPASPTLMLFKFNNRPLTELAADPASWGWKEAAMDNAGSLAPTLKVLADSLDAARARAHTPGVPDSDPYLRFYLDVASNPLWNGVLFLNAPVDFTEMPQPLQFLAAGVDTGRFYGHHIGFSVTPYSPGDGTIELGQTAAFGLIDYSDPRDLVAAVPPQPFGFKTLQLQVIFANAAVADFSAQVELMVNRLFGSQVQKQDPSRGNNLALDGSYQRVGGAPSYSFVLRGENLYQTQNTALQSVEVNGTRLETSSAAGADSTLAARFILSGKMRFALIETFDLFSYGPDPATGADGHIAFDGLAVGMSFPLAAPSQQTFSIAEAALSFDTSPAGSAPRPQSLANNFPLQLLQLVASPNVASEGQPPQGRSPADLGFTSISAPLDQTPMDSPWYGLSFNLDFGTLGSLTGAIGLKVTLLAAWMQGPPQGETPPVFLGLKLADSKAFGGSLPLQGVLKLGFRSFQFETYTNDQDELAYLLRMRRFALSVLAWSFPPGNADLLLFGAPGRPRSALGWYAAYSKDAKSEQAGRVTQTARPALAREHSRHLQSGRRTPPVGAE
jgi:hypothetical protein